jgi:hypothetical protein
MINFHIGKKRTSLKDMMILSAILAIVVGGIASFTNLPKQKIWCAIDQLTRRLNNDTLEDVKLKIDEILTCRAQEAIDKGEDDFKKYYEILTGKRWKPVEITPPLYSEEAIDLTVCYTGPCQALGGAIRLCSQWIEGCEGTPVEYEELVQPEFRLDKLPKDKVEFFKF